jgi:hypothetical protein
MFDWLRRLLSAPPDSDNPRVEAKGGSVATAGDIINSQIITSLSEKHVHLTLALSRTNSSLNELCELLEARAWRIIQRLQDHFSYAPVADFLKRFNELHQKHLSAIRSGNVIVAHEILNEIHGPSFQLSKDEFWSRHAAQEAAIGGIIAYQLNIDAFERGALIRM